MRITLAVCLLLLAVRATASVSDALNFEAGWWNAWVTANPDPGARHDELIATLRDRVAVLPEDRKLRGYQLLNRFGRHQFDTIQQPLRHRRGVSPKIQQQGFVAVPCPCGCIGGPVRFGAGRVENRRVTAPGSLPRQPRGPCLLGIAGAA